MRVAFLFLLLPFFTPQERSNSDVLTPIVIDSSEIFVYDHTSEFTQDRTDSVALDTVKGVVLWGDKVGFRKDGKWILVQQQTEGLGYNNMFHLKSVEFADVNRSGSDELILHIWRMSYGNKGGTDYKYIQIWDMDTPALIYGGLTLEEFGWFSGRDFEEQCKREITYSSGEITIPEFECVRAVESMDALKDTLSGTFHLVDGVWLK